MSHPLKLFEMVKELHARDLIELAAQVAIHGQTLATGAERISRSGLESYWKASKSRLDRWGSVLRKYNRESVEIGEKWARNQWPAIAPVLEEVLTGEILSRVWCGTLKAHDEQHGQVEAEPMGRTILVGHAEVHNRVLRLLATTHNDWSDEAEQLDHLRRRCERWTDLLISYLAPCCDVSDRAPSPSRMRDFAEASQQQQPQGAITQSQTIALGSLRTSFQTGLSATSPNADLNAQIAMGVISCFPPDIFDTTLFGPTLWLARVESTAADAQCLLDELLYKDGATG